MNNEHIYPRLPNHEELLRGLDFTFAEVRLLCRACDSPMLRSLAILCKDEILNMLSYPVHHSVAQQVSAIEDGTDKSYKTDISRFGPGLDGIDTDALLHQLALLSVEHSITIRLAVAQFWALLEQRYHCLSTDEEDRQLMIEAGLLSEWSQTEEVKNGSVV